MNRIELLTLIIVILLVGCQDSADLDSSADDIASAASALTITYATNDSASNVTQDLTLPTTTAKGVSISWRSSSPSVISDTGVVTRPAAGQYDAPVILTATLTKNSASRTKTFSLVVEGIATINIAQGKPVETDSEEADNLAIYGNDGKYQTRWSAADGNHNHWYILNLQRSYDVKRSKIILESSLAYQYQILGSKDKQNWFLIVDRSNNSEWSTLFTDSIDANYQFFKIVILDALKRKPQPENTWAGFNEWELY